MGTDIHSICEYYSKEEKRWITLEEKIFNKLRATLSGPELVPTNTPLSNRNYFLFATLANVRNDGEHAYISDPKGYPDDMDPHSEVYLNGEHSASYLTLDEIINWEGWGIPVKGVRAIKPSQYLEALCGKIMTEEETTHSRAEDGILVEEKDIERMIRDPSLIRKDKYVAMKVNIGYPTEFAGRELKNAVQLLRDFADHRSIPYDEVRFVFDFDS